MRYVKTRTIYGMLSLTAAVLLTGCAADYVDGGSRGLVPIGLTASVQEGSATGGTRAGTDVNDGYLPENTTFEVGFSGNTTLSGTTTYETTDAEGHTKCTGTQPYFTLTGTSTTVYAYYPTKPGSTFSVKTDQDDNEDANYRSSDLMYAYVENFSKTGSTATANLSFGHKMSKIIVNATMGTGITSISEVRIIGGYRTIGISDATTCALSARAEDLSGPNSTSADDYIKVYSGTYSTEGGTLQCAALIPPQRVPTSGETATDFLQIVTNEGTITYSLNGKTFSSNNVYTFNANLTASQVGTTIGITNWNENGNATIITNGGGSLSLDKSSVSTVYRAATNPTVEVTEDGVTTCYIANANTNVATASASGTTVTITPVNAGTTEVLVYAVKGGSILSSVVNVTVNKAEGTISYETRAVSKEVDETFTNPLTKSPDGTGTGTVTYSITSNGSGSTIDEYTGEVTVGNVADKVETITATVTDSDNYTYPDNTATYTLTVTTPPGVDVNSPSINDWGNGGEVDGFTPDTPL